AADRGADFYGLRVHLYFGDNSALVNCGSYRAGVDYFSWLRRCDCGWLEEFEDLGPSSCVAEADQGKGGVASHGERRVGEHFQESFMESGGGCFFADDILAHDPGVGVADFFDGIGGQANDLGIPLDHAWVVSSHAFADLYQGVLNVSGMLLVLQILG